MLVSTLFHNLAAYHLGPAAEFGLSVVRDLATARIVAAVDDACTAADRPRAEDLRHNLTLAAAMSLVVVHLRQDSQKILRSSFYTFTVILRQCAKSQNARQILRNIFEDYDKALQQFIDKIYIKKTYF